jgi:hypothetical protein
MNTFNKCHYLPCKFDPEDVVLVTCCQRLLPIEILKLWKRFGSDEEEDPDFKFNNN